MEKNKSEFGEFIANKRREKGISLRNMAKYLGYSAPFWSDVEKGRANPPHYEKLATIAEILRLADEDKIRMYDLAGHERSAVAPDVDKYLTENYFVISGVRQARDLGASESDWQKFIENLQEKHA